MWLMKVKESQQFQFFASYAIDIHANEFQPTDKAAFICSCFCDKWISFKKTCVTSAPSFSA